MSDLVKITVVREPSKSYLLTETPHVIMLQACSFNADKASIRGIITKIGHHHMLGRFQVIGMIWEIIKEFKQEDYIFDSAQEAELHLEELAKANNWKAYI